MKFENILKLLSESEDYRISHTAPTSGRGSPLHDLSDTYPDDIYSDKGAQYYGDRQTEYSDEATIKVFRSTRGKPQAEVVIYRAVPNDDSITDINKGDWVTVNRRYAEGHGKRQFDDYKILKKIVKAKDLYTDGNSIHEFGYDPS